MTTLSLLSLLLGAGLLVLSHRMESDARAHEVIIGILSALSITRAACACLIAFGGVGILVTLALPSSDASASRLAAGAGIAAAMIVLLMAPRTAAAEARSEEWRGDDQTTVAEDDAIVGMTGTFVAARTARAPGRVVIRRGDATVAFAARPVVGSHDTDRWDSVVIVDVFQGTALVAPVVRDGPRP
jgi:uncharacterized membrane protein YeiB